MTDVEKPPKHPKAAPTRSGMTFEEAVAKMLHTPPSPEKQAKKAAKKEHAKQQKAQGQARSSRQHKREQ